MDKIICSESLCIVIKVIDLPYETGLHVIFDVSKNHVHSQRIKFVPSEFIPKMTHSLSSTLLISFITPITIWTCFIDLLTLDGLYPSPECKLPESFTCLTQLSNPQH